MPKTADVSVVIRAYTEERWDDLVRAVESVQNQTTLPAEIVVVIDNNPALFMRAQERFPGVHVIKNRYGPGSTHVWNTGIETANGEIVAFIDDDAVAEPDWLERLLEEYSSLDVIGVGGHIEPNWVAGKPKWFPAEFNWVVGCSYPGLPTRVGPVRNLIGCNMSVKRTPLVNIGLFLTDSGLGHISGKPVGCEETELCVRLRQHYPTTILLHNPAARVHHVVPPSRATFRYFLWRCYLEGGSKALVSELVGHEQGLSSERAYTLKILPQGVLRGVRDTLFKFDLFGLARAGAIIAGFTMTATAYIIRRLSITRPNQGKPSAQPSQTNA